MKLKDHANKYILVTQHHSPLTTTLSHNFNHPDFTPILHHDKPETFENTILEHENHPNSPISFKPTTQLPQVKNIRLACIANQPLTMKQLHQPAPMKNKQKKPFKAFLERLNET